MEIGIIAYEIIECCVCGHMTVRIALPKHMRFQHGFTVEHAIAYVTPVELRADPCAD